MSAYKTTRRIVHIGLAVLSIVGAQLAIATGPAAAFLGYNIPTFFGTSGSGNGQFAEPTGVAVDDSSGDAYVIDQGHSRVQKFDAEGNYLSQFNVSSPDAIAVDNSSDASKGSVYVVDSASKTIEKFTSGGTSTGVIAGFASTVTLFGIAVDDAGHVWVSESDKDVQEFDGELVNKKITSIEPAFERSPGIAVDSQENLYLLRGEPNIAKFNSKGEELLGQLTICGCVTSLAIDPGNNDVFANQGNLIARYGPFGEPYFHRPGVNPYGLPIEVLEGISSSKGVAVNGVTHTLYATQQTAHNIAIFKTILLPDVTTGNASEIHRISAKLEGEVDPEGQEVTTCEFEYGTSEAYGQTAPCTIAPGSGTSPVTVTAEVSGLTQETSYHYRLVAGNNNRIRPNPGADRTFTTEPAVENLRTGIASAIQGACATLNGSFEPNGDDTHYWFEYGIAQSYGSSSSIADGGSAAGDEKVDTVVCGLTPDQVYDYRLVAENTFGKTNGQNETFRSAVLPPQIPGGPSAGFVAAQSAVLSAGLNPEHTSTRYHFEYGACSTLSGCANVQRTPDETSAIYGLIGTSAEVVGLAPSTTYRYRLVADNEFEEAGQTFGGGEIGAEDTFTTISAAVPSVETGGYGGLTPTSAMILGSVEPNGVPTSYAFELGVYNGPTTQYGVVSSGSAGASNAHVPVSLMLTGLQPGTTYAYRVTASSGYIINASHTLQGATITFTTQGTPSVLSTSPLLAILPVPAIPFPKEQAATCKKGFAKNKHGQCFKQKAKKKKRKSVHKGKRQKKK